MFDEITTGQIVRIHFDGSTQGLAMRVRYEGECGGTRRFSGLGVMADAKFTVLHTGHGWSMGNGRAVTKVEAL